MDIEFCEKLPTCEGFYAAHFPLQDHTTIVYVRFDLDKLEHVVDVIGHSKEHSGELWRYSQWLWSEAITVKPPQTAAYVQTWERK